MDHSEASKLIRKAARSVLEPLGLSQRGRSRTWLDDRGWYLVMVEFQPSSWSVGSHLNVGCAFLWTPQNHLSFDFSLDGDGRAQGFEPFESADQFAVIASQLVQAAARQVNRYRECLGGVADLAAHYKQRPPIAFWPRYHAAIALGLTGNTSQASRLFESLRHEAADTEVAWMREAAMVGREYARIVATPNEFRERIEGVIRDRRKSLRLVSTEHVLTG